MRRCAGESVRIRRLARVLLPQAGIDIAGTNGVDADVVGRQFKGQVPSKGDKTRLGAGVGGRVWKGVGGVDGTDVDHRSACGRKERLERLRQQKRGAKIDCEDFVPKSGGHLREW